MAKNFNVRSKELGLQGVPGSNTKLKDYLIGKRIRITGRTSGHNYGEVDDIVTLDSPSLAIGGGSGNNYTQLYYGKVGANTIKFTEFIVLENYTITDLKGEIKDLQAQVKEAKEKVEETKAKIKYMEENNLEIFNEDAYKAYQTLTLLENSDMSKLDKAQAIAKLISGS